jgi:hypothetical protein
MTRKVIATIEVKLVIEVPDDSNRLQSINSAIDVLTDANYSFEESCNHKAEGYKILGTEIISYDDTNWKVRDTLTDADVK